MTCNEDEQTEKRRFYQNRLFEGIPTETVDSLVAGIEIVSYAAGEVIFCEGDHGDTLFLVEEGSIRISKLGRANEQETLGFIQAGNFFGEMALLDGQCRSARATAAEATLLGVVDEATFRRILEAAPSSVHINFLKCVVQRLRDVNSHFIGEVMRAERLSVIGSMASSIIHDLKTPIGVIRCSADLLAGQNPDPNSRELTTIINKSADRMMTMAEEVLEFTKGRVSVDIRETPVHDLTRELEETAFRSLAKYKVKLFEDIQYEGSLPLDLSRFVRVVDNLVKNARQAMPHGGLLRWSIARRDHEAVFQVEDTGIGISKQLLPRIFEPFNTHGKSGGTGLGMAIAKSVVEAHRGTISVDSTVGVGTTVGIRLPLIGS